MIWVVAGLLLAGLDSASASVSCSDLPGSGCDLGSFIIDQTMALTTVRCTNSMLSWGDSALPLGPEQLCSYDWSNEGDFISLCQMTTERPLPPELSASFPSFSCADFNSQCCTGTTDQPTFEPTTDSPTAQPTSQPSPLAEAGLVLSPGEVIGIVLSVVLGVPAIVFPLMSYWKGVKTSEKLDEVGDDVHAIEVVTAEPIIIKTVPNE